MATGLRSWKIAKGLYIIPLLFAYTPLLGGSWPEIFTIFVFALAGLYAFTCALQGYMENPVGLPIRLLLLVLALALLKPSTLAIQGLALGCLLLVLVINIRKSGRSAQRSAAR